jgi:hypothetical protein
VRRLLIVGAPRSGTTWVGKTLGRTAGSTYVHEPDGTGDPFAFRAKRALPFTPVLQGDEDVPEYEQLWAGAFAGGRRPGTPRDLLARRLFARLSQEEKWKGRQTDNASWRVRLACAAAVPLASDGSKRNVIVKSVHAALALEWIAQRFDPVVLVVRRHPYNVLASRLEMGFKPGLLEVRNSGEFAARAWGVRPVDADESDLTKDAFHLGTLMLALHDAVERHPDWHIVSHEDLCIEPVAGFSSAAARLGLEWTAESEAFLGESNTRGSGYATNRVAAEQPDRWRTRLTAEQVLTIDTALARLPERLRSVL